MWSAYILLFTMVGNGSYVSQDISGAEVSIYEALGPVGMTYAECEAFINKPSFDQRKRVAADLKLKDHRQLKYACIQMPLSTK